MIIELRGLEFINKGSELMLDAILQKIRERIPQAYFVFELDTKYRPLSKCIQKKVFIKIRSFQNKNILRKLVHILPAKLRYLLGLIHDGDIDVIIDGSGFCYGDFWGAEPARERSGSYIRKWKSEGKKVIYLPQAFGPFTDPEIKKVMTEICAHADLICVRDKKSFEHLASLTDDIKNIKQFPDFTAILSGEVPKNWNSDKKYIAIIPNQKMLLTPQALQYIPFLSLIIKNLQDRGFRPFILLHTEFQDSLVANQINEALENPLNIVSESNPIYIKGIIGECHAVVGSRFHGLVSALCQNIPCLATGWSHKYEMLFDEYDFSEGLCDFVCDQKYIEEKVNLILDENSVQKIRKNLKQKTEEQKDRIQQMWDEVFDIIDKK